MKQTKIFKIYRVLAEAYLRKKFTAEHIANSARISVEEVQTILNSRSDIFDQASEENFAYHLVSDTRDLLREELASISSETIPNEKRQKRPHILYVRIGLSIFEHRLIRQKEFSKEF